MQITVYCAEPLPGESLSLAARRLLDRAARDAGLPLPLIVAEQADGKPYLPEHPGFHFNLSHSGGWAVCAVSSVPVGVDLQEIRPVRPALLRRLTPSERAQLAGKPLDAFFDLWTLKEAAAKCTGRCGIRGVLYGSKVTLSPPSVGMEGLRAASVPFPEAGLRLAVAAETEEEPEVALRFSGEATA